MKYSDFLNSLKQNKNLELVFNFNGKKINKDYHITEVLQSVVSAVDCGGKVDKWEEVTLQLVEPSENFDEKRFMEAKKAMRIFEKSFEKIQINPNSKVLIEFWPSFANSAQRFIITESIVEEEKYIVFATGLSTQCKALERKSEKSCCTNSGRSTNSQCCL